MRKADISGLLKKSRLTGKEAGRLVLADSHEVDHGRKGFLKQKDINALKASLTGRDIDEYNAFIETYRIASYTLKEARAGALEIERDIYRVIGVHHGYVKVALDRGTAMSLPVVVTQEEYDNIQKKQKEEKLKSCEWLEEVVAALAVEIGAQAGICERGDDLTEELAEEHPELEEQAKARIEELTEAGVVQEKTGTGGRKEILIGPLYEAGLQPWVEYVESPSADQGWGFLIIPEPYASNRAFVDVQKGRREQLLGDWESLGKRYGVSQVRSYSDFRNMVKETVRLYNKNFRTALRAWLPFVALFDALSDYIGVNLSEDIGVCYDGLMRAVQDYNETISNLPYITAEGQDEFPGRSKEPKLDAPPLRVDDLKPSKKMLKHLQERMALGLGEGWLEDAAAIMHDELKGRADD